MLLRTSLAVALTSTIALACGSPEALGEVTSALDAPPPPPSDPNGSAIQVPVPAVVQSGRKVDYQNPTIRTITAPENVTSLATPGYTNGRIRSTHAFYSTPFVDGFGIRTSFMGSPCSGPGANALGCYQLTFLPTNVNWSAGTFTGFTPTSTIFQYGFTDLTVPPTTDNAPNVYQLQGTEAGILINTKTFMHDYDWGEGPRADVGVVYGNPTSPFVHDGGELTLQSQVRVPTSFPTNGGAGRISFVISLRDRTSGESIRYQVKIWDSRSAALESSSLESMGDRKDNVTTFRSALLAGTRFVTMSPFSRALRYEETYGSLDFVRVHVSGAQLAEAAGLVEATYAVSLSKRPSDWELTQVAIRTEVSVGTDGFRQMLLGASFRELSVYEFY